MSFDNSRFTFDPRRDYAGVVMQQGRVQLDADWNEWLAELTRRLQAGTLDLLGRAVYPATTPFAFQIAATTSGGSNVLTIGPGRLYVDGLLAENHGDPATVQWDPALAELSNTPQPPPSAITGAIDFTKQPYMPPGTTLPAGGPFLAYLDVWIRPVDFISDPDLVDKAVGVDSTGRLQTVWQVRLFDVASVPGVTCDSTIPNWPPAASAGLLSTGTTPSAPSGPCCLTSGAAYTGLENQFYRVEIHQPGAPEGSAVPPTTPPTGATFKFSRDNRSVTTSVTAIANVTNSAGNPASQLTVVSLGRDQVLGFAPGNWIEILSDATEFAQTAGELHQIDTIDVTARTITLATTLGASFPPGPTVPAVHTRIRRWDQSGKVYEQDGTTVWWDIDAEGRGDIPVPTAGTALILENGITVSFDVSSAGGQFVAGDFWTFAARTADGSVETLVRTPPRGIHHHYTRLSIVTFPGSATDCRTKWPPSTGSGSECGCCCTVTVGDGVESVGQFTSINAAIGALPADGGEVCILRGRYFENVLIQGRRDLVLRGCGWQTRIASASLNPKGGGAAAPGGATPAPGGGAPASAGTAFAAVITISRSEHVQLLSFGVEAARDEVGVLVDDTVDAKERRVLARERSVDVTIEDLIVTASTRPAILARDVTLLQVESNRIAMDDVRSQWPAVRVNGKEIRILRNWLGVRSTATTFEWLPLTVAGDLSAADASASATPAAGASGSTTPGAAGASGSATIGAARAIASTFGTGGAVPRTPGGIQIAGPSVDVFVLENEIDEAGRNGITLGSFSILDANGDPTTVVTGVTVEVPGPCDTTRTLTIPVTTGGGGGGGRVVASGPLRNIQICRNRIRNTGLCGIGPVGFFNLKEEFEVITIENLTIAANTIASTLLADVAAFDDRLSLLGYGAITVPDVVNLVIRDNAVTDFGRRPGGPSCGIFVLHGEMVEISRNQVLETRDWVEGGEEPGASAVRGGILLVVVTPPTFTASASFTAPASFTDTAAASAPVDINVKPVFLPNLPALRVAENTVRVPLGDALTAVGFGPFSIVDNHFATGGRIVTRDFAIGATVQIMNLSASLEAQTLGGRFTQLNEGSFALSPTAVRATGAPGCGAVIFTNNTCQLEARLSRQRSIASVVIFTLDDLIFSNNACWLDGAAGTAFLDALLAGASVQVTSNRFQEAAGFSVLASGFTVGMLNVTSHNISTYCLFANGILQPAVFSGNLTLLPAQVCEAEGKRLNLHFRT